MGAERVYTTMPLLCSTRAGLRGRGLSMMMIDLPSSSSASVTSGVLSSWCSDDRAVEPELELEPKPDPEPDPAPGEGSRATAATVSRKRALGWSAGKVAVRRVSSWTERIRSAVVVTAGCSWDDGACAEAERKLMAMMSGSKWSTLENARGARCAGFQVGRAKRIIGLRGGLCERGVNE